MKIILAIKAKSQQPEYSVNEQIKDLYTCLAAHLGYLQEDHSNLVVGGCYSSKAQLIYKDLRRNKMVFPPSAFETLKSAITLANASNQDQQGSSNRGTGGFGRNRFYHNRQRGRGRGWPNQSGDNNPGFIPRSVSTDQQDTA